MDKKLKKLLKRLQNGEPFSFFEVMETINEVANVMTLTERPPAAGEILTICELNGRCCCGD